MVTDTARGSFLAGLAAVAPILAGVVPFGLVAGFSAIDAGLTLPHAVGLSTIVFAGASQLAAIELIRQDSATAVVVLTVAVINARMMMYSASLAPYFRTLPLPRRAGAAYLLTDQAFAVSVVRYAERTEPAAHRLVFYLGAGAGLWTTWQITTVIGAVVGTGLPEGLSLDFAIPLVFLALLVPTVTDRPSTVAALVAAVVAVAGWGLPYNSGLIAGAFAGIGAGLIGGRR